MPTEHIIALLIADRDKTQPGDKEAQERKVGRRAQSTIPAHEGVLSGEAEEAARMFVLRHFSSATLGNFDPAFDQIQRLE